MHCRPASFEVLGNTLLRPTFQMQANDREAPLFRVANLVVGRKAALFAWREFGVNKHTLDDLGIGASASADGADAGDLVNSEWRVLDLEVDDGLTNGIRKRIGGGGGGGGGGACPGANKLAMPCSSKLWARRRRV